jgi:hypothetical protein
MFFLLEIASESWIFGVIPEPLEVLIFGIGLVAFAIGLRWLMKRTEKTTDGKIGHTTE